MFTRIAELWCRTMHRRAMWPMHGRYTCSQCMRQYEVRWDGRPEAPRSRPGRKARLSERPVTEV